jgi:predicted secreted hydrolase
MLEESQSGRKLLIQNPAPGNSAGSNCLTYNAEMMSFLYRLFFISVFPAPFFWLASCAPATVPSAELQIPDAPGFNPDVPSGFAVVDGSRPLSFPQDFGAHPDFRIEWWYYTGNLDTPQGRHFGFELTFFRVGLLPPTVELPADSKWYDRSLYFAHFAVSDIASEQFYAFERYSRPGPPAPAQSPGGPGGLAGAQADPYRVWLEDWNVTQRETGVYQLQAAQAEIALNLTLTDEMGIVLHGENGYSRGGKNVSSAAYYYSQPRLRANGIVQVDGVSHPVSGLAWKDHEFSSGVLDEDQIGWDWFSLQFEGGPALMMFQLRERDGEISVSSSGTFIGRDGTVQSVQNTGFKIDVLSEWRSPHTQGVYPAAWEIRMTEPDCILEVHPWMADQEINFPAFTYWEGAVHFEGTCNGAPARGNGYVELTGYAGNVPLR